MAKKSETKKVFEHNKGTTLPVTPKDRSGTGPARSVPHVSKGGSEKPYTATVPGKGEEAKGGEG